MRSQILSSLSRISHSFSSLLSPSPPCSNNRPFFFFSLSLEQLSMLIRAHNRYLGQISKQRGTQSPPPKAPPPPPSSSFTPEEWKKRRGRDLNLEVMTVPRWSVCCLFSLPFSASPDVYSSAVVESCLNALCYAILLSQSTECL